MGGVYSVDEGLSHRNSRHNVGMDGLFFSAEMRGCKYGGPLVINEPGRVYDTIINHHVIWS